MENVLTQLLTLAVMIYGLLLMVGGLTGNPWKFANRPYKWLFKKAENFLRGIIKMLWKMLSAFCRRYPLVATVFAVALAIIAFVAMVRAGFI